VVPIDAKVDHETVLGLVLIVVLLVVVGPLALFVGADSRFDEVARRRRQHP
jgi:hypothetical protein